MADPMVPTLLSNRFFILNLCYFICKRKKNFKNLGCFSQEKFTFSWGCYFAPDHNEFLM